MRWVIGYLCLGLSAFLILSVVSFHPTDTALLVSSPNVIMENIGGRGGAWISSYLVIAYGQPAAILLSFGLLVVGLHVLAKTKLGHIWIKVLLFFIAAISLSVVCGVFVPRADYMVSGLIGMTIVATMENVLPRPMVGGIFLFLCGWSLVASFKFLQKLLFFLMGSMMALFSSSREKEKEALNEVFSEMSLEESTEEVFFAPEMEEKREEPEFLRRPGQTEEGEDTTIKAPFWLTDPSGKRIVKQEIAQLFNKEHIKDQKAQDNDVLSSVIPLPSEEESEEYIENTASSSEHVIENLSSENHDEAREEIISLEEKKEMEEDIFSFSQKQQDLVPQAVPRERISLRDEKPSSWTSSYRSPDTSLLEIDLHQRFGPEDEQEVKAISHLIEMTFKSFKIDVRVVGYSRGPAITRYEVQPPTGLKLRTITNLIDDLALNLGDAHIRIVTPIGERGLIGIEVPNRKRRHVFLREVVESAEFQQSDALLPLILGKDITGNMLVDDLTEMPHLLIAGTTGSGKSVYVNAFLASLLFKRSYEDLRFLLIDPKMVELELYNGLPHLLAPVINQPEVAIVVLEWVVREMERRYKLFSELGIRNMSEYRQLYSSEKTAEKLYYLVVVIDEFADLMLRIPKETERVISRLAAMARAVGIHLVVATQRPSVDVVTGIIKANFPSRVAFRVSSQTDSRTILDRGGAEKLLGKGDMLFLSPKNTDLLRLQAPYVSGKEIETLVYEIKRQKKVEYLLDVDALMEEVENPSGSVDGPRDPLFEEAIRLAAETGEVSASFLQRKLRIGYNRASRIVDMMESMRILGPSTGTSKPREVLIPPEEVDRYLDMLE